MRLQHLLSLLILTLCWQFGATLRAEETPAIQIDYTFQALAQGQLGVFRVHGTQIAEIHAAFLGQQVQLFPASTDSFWGVVAVPIEAETGLHRLSVLVIYEDGEQVYFHQPIRVNLGDFPEMTINLTPRLAYLADREVALDELNLMDQAIQNTQYEGAKWWETGFLLPPFPRIRDGFGTWRQFNNEVWQRHTGIDYPTTIGSLVPVMADGEVVLVTTLEIRGNYILVDHGDGLFSGYAHLSKTLVEVGDEVLQGNIIGEVGSTGRSSGPHLHWEIALNGVWVDPLKLNALLPITP